MQQWEKCHQKNFPQINQKIPNFKLNKTKLQGENLAPSGALSDGQHVQQCIWEKIGTFARLSKTEQILAPNKTERICISVFCFSATITITFIDLLSKNYACSHRIFTFFRRLIMISDQSVCFVLPAIRIWNSNAKRVFQKCTISKHLVIRFWRFLNNFGDKRYFHVFSGSPSWNWSFKF